MTSLRRHSDVVDLNRYSDELCQQLMTAAEGGGPEVEQLASRLVATLQSATRLLLLEVLSAAASEITSELAPGSVELRLRGLDPEFVVTSPLLGADDDLTAPATEPTTAATAPVDPPASDDRETSRMTLRLPEPLKARLEAVAAAEGVSVNAWLVRTLAAVVEPSEPAPQPRRLPSGGQRLTGWAR